MPLSPATTLDIEKQLGGASHLTLVELTQSRQTDDEVKNIAGRVYKKRLLNVYQLRDEAIQEFLFPEMACETVDRLREVTPHRTSLLVVAMQSRTFAVCLHALEAAIIWEQKNGYCYSEQINNGDLLDLSQQAKCQEFRDYLSLLQL